MKKTRVASLVLALVLCLGLLPMTALAEEPASYAVVFYDDFSGGNSLAILTTDEEGRLASFPAAPTSAGMVFLGWVEVQGGSFIEEDHVFTQDTKLFAQWVNVPYINLDPNGGVCPVSRVNLNWETYTAPTLDEELPTPTRPGYTFLGWFWNGEEIHKGSSGFSGGGSEIAVAKWAKDAGDAPAAKSYRIDFIPNGGKIVSFLGASIKDHLEPANGLMVDQNSGIGFVDTDGDGRLAGFPVIEREGYTLDGWYVVGSSAANNAYGGKEVDIPSGAKKADSSTVFRADTLLAAKWTESKADSGLFTVKFDLNYKNAKLDETPEDQTVAKGGAVSLPDGSKLTPPSDSYEFHAWCLLSKDKAGKDMLVPWNRDQAVTSDMTLYAGWVRKGKAVMDGESIDAKPVETTKTAETQKPTETQKPAETQKPVETPAPAFTDVAATSPFAPAIAWAVEKGITNGTTPTTFAPGTTCTRGHILTFLWRSQGSPEPTIANPFKDEVPGAFQKAAVWAHEKGLVTGDTFGSSDPCTRASSVTYMWKLAGSPEAKAASFKDVSADSDYAKAVSWAVEQGVTNGTGDGTAFSPDNTCTRGQIVTFLYRAYEK